MNGVILRSFLFLIVCTLIAIVAFHAGVQFSEHDKQAAGRTVSFRPIYDNNKDDQSAFNRGVFPDISLLDFGGNRNRRGSKPVDNSAMAVDGPIYSNSSQLIFYVPEKFVIRQRMGGGFFYTPPHDGTFLLQKNNETAAKAASVMTGLAKILNTHPVSTSLLYSFSPDVERRIRTMFPDPMNENIFYANSPALFWDRDYNNGAGRLIVIMRIWLDRERYEEKNNWPKNTFLDNYFYTRTYDSNFKPIDPGHIMGIPTNGGSTLGDGPIEPRLFPAFNRSNLFVSFNAGMTGLKNKAKDYTLIWNYNSNKVSYPVINGYSPMLDNPNESFPRDKHWSAFNMPPKKNPTTSSRPSDVIHFVHNLDPLRILECDADFQCHIIYAAGTAIENVFEDLKHHLRGGTPFVHFDGNYYVGFGHVTLFKKRTSDTRRYYTTNLVLLRAEPEASPPYRVVFISDPLKISKQLLNSVPIVRYMYIEDPFIFPVGLLLENRDTAILGVHINDHTAVLIRIRGLEALLNEAIATDKLPASTWDQTQSTKQSPHKFLADGELVGPNRFTRLLAEQESGAEFEYFDPD